MKSSFLKRVLRRLLQVAVVVGLVIFLTVRDSRALTGPLFYAMPLPVLVVGAGVLGLTGQGRERRVWLGLAGVVAVGWLGTTVRLKSPAAGEPGTSFLLWNMDRPGRLSEPLVGKIRELGPDVVALVETEDFSRQICHEYETALPGWHAVRLGYGMAVIHRGVLNRWTMRHTGVRTHFAVMEFTLEHGPCRVILVDGDADPLHSRAADLAVLREAALEEPGTVILGDFNTPVTSAHFSPWRAGLTHAFTEAGRGVQESWPLGLPLLSLDHVWATRDLRWREAAHFRSRASDHDMVWARLVGER